MARKLLVSSIALAAVLGFATIDGIASAAAATSSRTASAVASAKTSKQGTFLVADGNAVYTLKPSKKPCDTDAKCLKAWPPVLLPQGVTTATAGSGVDAAKLGTVTTPSGALQVTYGGKALYWFYKDKAPSQVKGNIKDKWGKWHTVVTVKAKAGSGKKTKPTAGTGGTSF
jgi:predicted lipoprotein with Yx(FWY)xxD motif